ncbi:UvrD-helicase domain-containing protein [Psychromonas sp. L1A2]|uniref:UvrD-helicase domain-containing protein n=1 Tax=Psychromonas sp. L1A2 TaxID=2686356 RepID=UPI00135C1089|nr:ATP-dependent helicase [Psychromonas sp. L1A2]
MSIIDISQLNDEQIDAIQDDRNIFLVAAPGSGKTRALTYKIAKELSELDEQKKWIVAITYTNRAAEEIKERIELLGIDTKKLWIGTIHGFCIEWILKPYGVFHQNLKNGYSIINSYDSEEIISLLCKSISNPTISYYDCNHYFTSTRLEYSSCTLATRNNVVAVLNLYHQKLISENQVDFELILLYAYQLIDSQPLISVTLSRLFKHVLIDEFQDTREIQYSIFSRILKAGRGGVKGFIVGDPNQAIYGSLGGYAISLQELEQLSGQCFVEKQLNKNYRSSLRIINHFSNYKVYPSAINAAGDFSAFQSTVTFNCSVHKDYLAPQLAGLIRASIEDENINENEICIVAPWWIHLASMTRKLIALLPEYDFNGPGMTPFARDEDNFWYKVTKIALTEPSPSIYIRRLRWASEIIKLLEAESYPISSITPKKLLKVFNSIDCSEEDGLNYLDKYFQKLEVSLEIDLTVYPSLSDHRTAFFESASKRVDRIISENEGYAGSITDFKKVFGEKKGITVSTIHGVKGAEFDVVIAYGLLEGIVPHFNETDANSAYKLLYVIGSRARKHLHLISEQGRGSQRYPKYPTTILEQHVFPYD